MTQQTTTQSRREHILQTLAEMLEKDSGGRITTAALSKQVGVSEAALYRHFPSKAKMFEALIGFIEESVFSQIHRLIEATREDDISIDERLRLILTFVLAFAERNPGLCRLLNGEVLSGDVARLRPRIAQFYERVETQLKQLLREAELAQHLHLPCTITAYANLIGGVIEGRIGQYVRSNFRRKPTDMWQDQWRVLAAPLV
ncbi:nucleoid occlusion factor SlmA [Carnimonas bestiolae]|uniref:nucleoid occlusion factor SlmA n=1 Tax=Carnimonas bestiolae TaxID=3402172 RepID=UPI003EDCA261